MGCDKRYRSPRVVSAAAALSGSMTARAGVSLQHSNFQSPSAGPIEKADGDGKTRGRSDRAMVLGPRLPLDEACVTMLGWSRG
jgi:hypothetical protein